MKQFHNSFFTSFHCQLCRNLDIVAGNRLSRPLFAKPMNYWIQLDHSNHIVNRCHVYVYAVTNSINKQRLNGENSNIRIYSKKTIKFVIELVSKTKHITICYVENLFKPSKGVRLNSLPLMAMRMLSLKKSPFSFKEWAKKYNKFSTKKNNNITLN